jgi:hypothetical protein
VALWGIAAGVYGLVLAIAALTHPIRRRPVACVAAVAYALVSFGAATLTSLFWVNLLVPGGLLLVGYWLGGWFFRSPQSWLEQWLLDTDRAAGAHRWMSRMPRPVAELLEASYVSAYAVVGGGAIFAATFGGDAVTNYWSLVLTAELASYAFLPWLRSRPPRVLESLKGRALALPTSDALALPTSNASQGAPYLRRLNTAILDNASVQANTLPSGHVAGAVAAALGVMAVAPIVGWMLMATAGLIAVAAVAGRYHYAVDCVAGAAVALVVWSVLP